MIKKQKWTLFSTSELKPTGWLKRQLEIQANGLSGNLDKIWPDIRDSKWIGGDKEGWERVPYWLDGFIPLAWILDDMDMQARAEQYIDAILSQQQEDGWICPCSDEERNTYDIWALFLICKVLALYADCSGDKRAEQAVYNAMKQCERHIESHTLFNWAASRWYEALVPLLWLYERYPEKWIVDLCYTLSEQGIDYTKVFEEWRYQKPHEHGRWSFMTHVVNLAMCLKAEALMSRINGKDGNSLAKKAIGTLLRDHGMAVGHFTGDECLSGTSPVQGSECCSVVEAMYSYEVLLAITGDVEWADRLESLAYNALPATLSSDMWAHQYDQMTNQVQCSRIDDGFAPFRTNSGEAHLFGLEPNYGCCTANFNQGWPKFALSVFMKADDGVVQSVIAPAIIKTIINGVPVEIESITEYPFKDNCVLRITADMPVEFTFYARVPSCVESASIDGKLASCGYIAIHRTWNGTQEIAIDYNVSAKFEKRPSGMYCVRRGGLLYSVSPTERWEKLEYQRDGVERKYPYCDYEIFAESKWNYGFASDEFKAGFGTVSGVPFNSKNPPIWLEAELAEIEWELEQGVCTEYPKSTKAISEVKRIRMIPYGCTNLRMTEMPIVE